MESMTNPHLLKVKLHQPFASYRNPLTTEVTESYPLPPPSTVLGFVSALLAQKELSPSSLNVSIQGNYGSVFRDFQWYKKGEGLTRYPIVVHTLQDVSLLFHFYFNDTSMAESFLQVLKRPPYYPYLGRAEDFAKIEFVKFTRLLNKSPELDSLKMGAYLDPKIVRSAKIAKTIPYRLPAFQRLIGVNSKQEFVIRDFDWLDLEYVGNGTRLWKQPELMKCDLDGDPIWWCMRNPIP